MKFCYFSTRRWYGPGRIGRDFRSYQALLTVHIWFLHKRLLADQSDPHKAALIQEELFDIFWIDSSNRMRAHGVNEMLINKNLKKVQQYSFMHMFHYDHCYTGDLLEEPADRLEALKQTIKTHILLLPSLSSETDGESTTLNGDDGHIDEEILQKHIEHDDQAERIAWYIETQYQNIIHDLPDDFFRKARIAWVDLPSFDRMIDGNTGKEVPKQTVDPEDILPLDWTKSIANDGSYYYWNLKTREAMWERPG
jgi:cytochrome b pre-mRNA-processing protein 3